MAAIREELILADRFSATFNRFLNMMKQSTAASSKAAADQKRLETAAAGTGTALSKMADGATDAARELSKTGDSAKKMSDSTDEAAKSQDKMNSSMKKGESAASGLGKKLLSLAGAYISLRSAQAFINLTDTYTQTTARLGRLDAKLQTTTDAIYQSAQRSRGAYQETVDMVAKLGTLAPDAFNSGEELVAFAEQINKQFALAGTNTQGQQAAMLQLTQAMSSGVLRGEELNSVLENAPTIAQSIAKYLGVSVGEMREMASEGQITAQVVKAAMFEAEDETNAAFEKIPLTFGQAWTMASNAAVRAMQPAMDKLNDLLNSELGQKAVNGLIAAFELLGSVASGVVDLLAMGAQWVADNWDIVQPILIGIAAAAAFAGAQMVASAIMSAIAWAAANWPLLLIAAGVALIIYMARQMGATWEEIGGVVGGVFGLMYAQLMNNFVVPAQNILAAFVNFFGNLFNDPVAAIKVLFLDLAVTILGHIASVAHGIENLINKIPGLHVNLTGAIDNIYNMVKGAAQTVKDESGWKEYVKAWDYVDYSEAAESGAQKGKDLGRKLDEFSLEDVLSGFSQNSTDFSKMMDSSGIPDTLGGIKGDTGAIKRSVALSEEDMKLLADMAERQYVNNINLTAQTPVITINGQNTGDTEEDLRWLENALQKILVEQAASHTDMSYA